MARGAGAPAFAGVSGSGWVVTVSGVEVNAYAYCFSWALTPSISSAVLMTLLFIS